MSSQENLIDGDVLQDLKLDKTDEHEQNVDMSSKQDPDGDTETIQETNIDSDETVEKIIKNDKTQGESIATENSMAVETNSEPDTKNEIDENKPMIDNNGTLNNGQQPLSPETAMIDPVSNGTELKDIAESKGKSETAPANSANGKTDSTIIMQSDVTDFIEFRKSITDDSNTALKNISSFRLEFSDVVGISPISPSKAWLHNCHKLKLVDIEKEEVIRSYYSDAAFAFVNGLNENIVFLCFHNEIDRLSIDNNETNTINTLLNFSSGLEQSKECRLNTFTLSKSGDFIVCLTRRSGCACFAKDISYIERFDSRAKFVQRSKITNKGKQLMREAFQVIENNNGDICIAGEKYSERGEFWVIVLDSKFQYRFSYDRNTPTQKHIPTALAVDPKNNILIVNTFRDRNRKSKDALEGKKRKDLTYVALIDEDGIFRDHLPTDGLNKDGIVRNINTDSDGKIWIIMDSGHVFVSKFEYPPNGEKENASI